MKPKRFCIAVLSLSSPTLPAALVWTAAGDGQSVFQEANWIDDSDNSVPPAGTVDGSTPISSSFGSIVMDLDNEFYGSFGPHFDLGGNTLFLSGSNSQLVSNNSNGIRSNVGATPSTINASGSTLINVQFTQDLGINLSNSASLILRGGGNPLSTVTVDLAADWKGSITTLNETIADWTNPDSGGGTAHLDKVTIAGQPAVIGSNVQLISDGNTGAILTVIPEPTTALLAILGVLAGIRRRR